MKPLLDYRVRLALNHAIDRPGLFARSERPPTVDPFGYDVALAERLLADAGVGGGLALSVLTTDETLMKSDPFIAMARSLASIGVKLSVQAVGWTDWIERAGSGLAEGATLFHAGSGVFLAAHQRKTAETAEDPSVVQAPLRDLVALIGDARPADLLKLVATMLPHELILQAGTAPVIPRTRALRDQRRMRVWMKEDGVESLVALVAWWPGVMTASRTNYCGSIDDLVDDTLDDATNDGACFSTLEIMSHGGNDCIKLGTDWLMTSDFDAAGNPTNAKARRLLDALKNAMCPNGRLIFTACGQQTGSTLRNISKYINQAITVSGYSGIGRPPLAPGGVDESPDKHYQNGSTASSP